MTENLSLSMLLALFGTMLALALLPGMSALLVSLRAACHGFWHGMAVTFGIVCADTLFIILAIAGLSLLVEIFGEYYYLLQYVGAFILILFGVFLLTSKPDNKEQTVTKADSKATSFMAGFLLTLADQKALVFYFGFFPLLFDIKALSVFEMLIIIGITTISLFLAKLPYALFAGRSGNLFSNNLRIRLNVLAGGLLIAMGIFLFIRFLFYA